ncbi:MAG: hypothetical protein Q4D71_09350, partial [Oscillospiraceae bacterium]|nr:hypothetical protein [Oscillospiraceae bacterium]
YDALYREENYEELLSLGVRLQSNAEEMERGFLDKRKRWLKKRYDAQEIRYLGSDAHDPSRRPPLSEKNLRWFREHLGEEYRQKLFAGNARRIVEGS